MSSYANRIFSGIRKASDDVQNSIRSDLRDQYLVEKAVSLGALEEPALANVLKSGVESSSMPDGFKRLLSMFVAKREARLREVPFLYPDAGLLLGRIPLAKLFGEPGFVHLNESELVTHLFVSGASGSGKTNALMSFVLSLLGIGLEDWSIILVDSEKGDLKCLASVVTDSVVVADFVDDLLVPPPFGEVSDSLRLRLTREYLERVITHVGSVIWSNVGERSLEKQALDVLWDRGFFTGGVFPKIDDLLSALQSIKAHRGSARMQRLENLFDKFTLIKGAFTRFSSDEVLYLERLLSHRLTVVDVSSFDSFQLLSLLINLIEKLYFYKLKGAGRFSSRKVLFVVDEAYPLIPREANTPSGVPVFAELMAKTRSTGLGFVVAVQNPSIVHPLASANAGIKVAFRLDSEEAEFAGRNMGLDKVQREFLKTGVVPGVGLLGLNVRSLKPFPVCFPLVEEDRFSEALTASAEYRSKLLFRPVERIEELVWHPKWLGESSFSGESAETETARSDGVGVRHGSGDMDNEGKMEPEGSVFDERVRKMLQVLCAGPSLKLTELYEICGFGSKQCVEVKDYLLDKELAVVEKVRTGLRGGTFDCLELTEKGEERIRKLGLRYERLAGRGSFEHRYWQRFLADYYSGEGYGVRLEGDAGPGDHADVSLERDGLKVAVEVELSSVNVLSNLDRDFSNGYEAVVVVVLSARVEREVGKVLEAVSGERKGRVLLQRIGEYL